MDRLRHHFEVERALADQLRRARSRAERARIYETMYDTLFAEVPDHPRLVRRDRREEIARHNARKLRLVEPWLAKDARVLEIGSGDCTFAFELCRRVASVYGVELSEKSARLEGAPENFALVLYDGFEFPFAADSFQFAFSDQLVEHLHPEDAELHFRSVLRALAPDGIYMFRTPHRFTGPHDISRYFTNGEPQGFHLKEWTYRELHATLRACGYESIAAVWNARGRTLRMAMPLVGAMEAVLGALPRGLRRRLTVYPFPNIVVAARKGSVKR